MKFQHLFLLNFEKSEGVSKNHDFFNYGLILFHRQKVCEHNFIFLRKRLNPTFYITLTNDAID
jgi:hypothetical protein